MTARQYDVNFFLDKISDQAELKKMAKFIVIKKPAMSEIKIVSKKVRHFNRVEYLKYKGIYFRLYVDKNDSVYDVNRCEVLSWKEGGKPDEIKETREVKLFDKIKGNPFAIAVQKTMTFVEAAEL